MGEWMVLAAGLAPVEVALRLESAHVISRVHFPEVFGAIRPNLYNGPQNLIN